MRSSKSVPEISRRTFLVGGSMTGAVSIGPFAQAAMQRPDTSAVLLQTSGHAASGKGAALYVYDASVDGRYVAANPRTSFVSADGRGFRLSLDQTITPFMFGAVGSTTYDGINPDLTADDTLALQAFFDFCQQNRVESANWGGVFGVTAELFLGGHTFGDNASQYTHSETIDFNGSIVLVAKSNINGAMLRVRTRRSATYGPITITHNKDNNLYANRRFDFGILVEDRAMFQVFSTVQVYQARIAGVLVQTTYIKNALEGGTTPTFYSNTYHNSFQSCHFENCGSGNLTNSMTSTFGGKRQEGAGDSAGQRTYLRANTLPPALVENYGIPIFVRINGSVHSVRSITHADKFMRVYPWVDLNSGASGTLEYLFGGGFVTQGGDTAITSGKISAMNCAAGIVAASLYNGYYTGTFQSCGAGIVVGLGPHEVGLGGSLKGYFEGNNIDVLWNLTNFNVDAYFTIESQHTLNYGKIRNMADPRGADNVMLKHPIYGLMVNGGANWRFTEQGGDGRGNWTKTGLNFDVPNAHVLSLHSDNPTIFVGDKLFCLFIHGYRARTAQITGTGANKQPTGTLTVVPPAGYKLNGAAAGANATFNGFVGPVTIQVALDPADATNFLVSFLSGRVERGPAHADSAAADVAALVSEFNALLTKLRAAGVIAS